MRTTIVRRNDFWIVTLAFYTLLSGCGPSPLPTAACPQSYIKPISLQVAAQSATSTVDLALSQSYMRKRIKDTIQTPDTDSQGHATSHGIDVNQITLLEKTVNGQDLHLIAINMTPWLRGQNGAHVSSNNTYELFLKLNPYIVDQNTVPDAAQRKKVLCGTNNTCTENEGVLLGFELHELKNKSQTTVVATGNGICGTVNLIDEKVLDGIWGIDGGLTNATPVVLPTASIAQMITGFAGVPVRVTGLALGSNTDLKIGMLMNAGAGHAFDSSTGFRPAVDWTLDLDSSVIKDFISMTANAVAASNNPPATVSDIAVKFIDQPENAVDVVVNLTLPICSTAKVRVLSHVRFDVCTDMNSQPILQQCKADDQRLPNNWPTNACVIADHLFRWPYIGNAIDPPCRLANSSTVLKFQVGPAEAFYATSMDVSDINFHIDGRSTVMDTVAAAQGISRVAKPHACDSSFSFHFP